MRRVLGDPQDINRQHVSGFKTHDSKDRAWTYIDFEVARVVRSYETDEQY